jgi:hypothetical protein
MKRGRPTDRQIRVIPDEADEDRGSPTLLGKVVESDFRIEVAGIGRRSHETRSGHRTRTPREGAYLDAVLAGRH